MEKVLRLWCLPLWGVVVMVAFLLGWAPASLATVINNPSYFTGIDHIYLDFEEYAHNTNLTDQYSGVVFSSEDVPHALQTTDPGDTSRYLGKVRSSL